MTKFTPIDRIGVHKIALIFLQKFGWVEREQPISDFGIDMHVEIVQNQKPTGQIFALQIKSGRSYFSEENENSFVYRGQKKHLDYWLSHSLPVLIVLYNPENNCSYWEFIDSSKVVNLEKGWKLEIPKKNILEKSIDKIKQFYSNPNHYTTLNTSDASHNGARRISAKILVESIQAQNRFSMKKMIPHIIEKFRNSDYYRNEITKKKHGDKLADVVLLFFYDGIQQVERGLPFCRVIWNEENCKFPVNPFTPDEVIVNNIGIAWDKNYTIFSDLIPENELPKGFYLETADHIYSKCKVLFKEISQMLERYDNTDNYKEFLEAILFLESQLDDLNDNQLIDGLAPLECQDIDSLISGIVINLHNILIIAKDLNREERNVVYLVRDYLNKVKEELPFYEYERSKTK